MLRQLHRAKMLLRQGFARTESSWNHEASKDRPVPSCIHLPYGPKAGLPAGLAFCLPSRAVMPGIVATWAFHETCNGHYARFYMLAKLPEMPQSSCGTVNSWHQRESKACRASEKRPTDRPSLAALAPAQALLTCAEVLAPSLGTPQLVAIA